MPFNQAPEAAALRPFQIETLNRSPSLFKLIDQVVVVKDVADTGGPAPEQPAGESPE